MQLEQLSSSTSALKSNLQIQLLKLNNDWRVLISLGILFHNFSPTKMSFTIFSLLTEVQFAYVVTVLQRLMV